MKSSRYKKVSQVALVVKNLPATAQDIHTHMGFPGGSTSNKHTCQCRRHKFDPWIRKIHWRRKWQSTPVFLPGKFHGHRSLVDFSPWGHKESDKTEHTCGHACVHTHTHTPTLTLKKLNEYQPGQGKKKAHLDI